MRIINIAVSTEEVEELGRRLAERGAHETANRLVRAERQGANAIALADVDQERLLDALTPAPEGRLVELRKALVTVGRWRAAVASEPDDERQGRLISPHR
jgi:hypothetical protein